MRGLNTRISGGVRFFELKTMEVAIDKVCLVEENLAMALGGYTGVSIGSSPTSIFGSRGGQPQAAGYSRSYQEPSKGGPQLQ